MIGARQRCSIPDTAQPQHQSSMRMLVLPLPPVGFGHVRADLVEAGRR
jgi:hypothetical protein